MNLSRTNILSAATILVGFYVVALYTYVHAPVFIEQKDLHDITAITDPGSAVAYHGVLNGFPHTYEVRSGEPFKLAAEVCVPDVEGAAQTVSLIIIKEVGERGRVKEVARLLARDASWESSYEVWSGVSYRHGGAYDAELEPGVYRIEVSSPNNVEPYTLRVGNEGSFGEVGYVGALRGVVGINHFFGNSGLDALRSPLLFVPIVLILCLGFVVFYRRP